MTILTLAVVIIAFIDPVLFYAIVLSSSLISLLHFTFDILRILRRSWAYSLLSFNKLIRSTLYLFVCLFQLILNALPVSDLPAPSSSALLSDQTWL